TKMATQAAGFIRAHSAAELSQLLNGHGIPKEHHPRAAAQLGIAYSLGTAFASLFGRKVEGENISHEDGLSIHMNYLVQNLEEAGFSRLGKSQFLEHPSFVILLSTAGVSTVYSDFTSKFVGLEVDNQGQLIVLIMRKNGQIFERKLDTYNERP